MIETNFEEDPPSVNKDFLKNFVRYHKKGKDRLPGQGKSFSLANHTHLNPTPVMNIRHAAFFLTSLILSTTSFAYKSEVGHDQLEQKLGSAMPTGAGIKVTQVEAPDGNDNYAPNTGSSEFSGKTFNLMSGPSGTSSHANGVAGLFYGNTNSMAPGVTVIDSYSAGNWVGDGFLRVGGIFSSDPRVEDSRVQNHSWVASASTQTAAIEATRRLDFAINRDGFVSVAGLNNGSGSVVPDLLGHAYNSITVGVSSGNHSRNGTRFDEAGRLKPDIVAPLSNTSSATPVVASAAAMLLEVADNDAGLANARHNPQVTKSILMAGATKEQFPSWGRTSEEPIDPVFGSGQLNVYNSHRILTGGEHGASLSTLVPSHSGWDFVNTQSSDLFYFFDFEQALETFTANLTWHRLISPTVTNDFANGTATLAEIHLTFYEADGFTVGNEVQTSISGIDNLQHIFVNTLSAGRYALGINVVSDAAGGTDYGLAWDAVVIPEPRFAALLFAVAAGLLLIRRKRAIAVSS